ncbi:LAGLIDADG family homing endonuclease [Bacillus sp. OTU530]|uniref:LAGLIDADG family homing endonuclease n=1 Tax=Bacillus sp. OTU530 TaxID=3043862 RepID=UPI00313EF34F
MKKSTLQERLPKELAYKMYIERNMTQKEIASIFGISPATIEKLLSKYGLRKKRLKDRVTKEELFELYVKKRLSTYDIAKMFNVTKGAVLNLMNQYDIPRRNEKESHYKYSIEYIHGVTKELLEDLYVEQEWSIQMIANALMLSYSCIYKYLDEFGIPTRDLSVANKLRYKRDPNVNVDFFKKLTPELAYILGLLATDGNVGDNGEIGIGLIDEDVINWVAKTIGYTRKIYAFDDGNKNHNVRYWIRFTNEEVAALLKKYEIVPRKTNKLKFPLLPNNMLCHYIRGVFEGDGTVVLGERKGKRGEGITYNPEANIVSASIEFIKGVKKVIDAALGINYKITVSDRESRKGILYAYRIYSNDNVRRFGEWLYRDGVFGMKRKCVIFCTLGSNI